MPESLAFAERPLQVFRPEIVLPRAILIDGFDFSDQTQSRLRRF
jgi:hypothetical protein